MLDSVCSLFIIYQSPFKQDGWNWDTLASRPGDVLDQHRFRNVKGSRYRSPGCVSLLFYRPLTNLDILIGIWMENGRCVISVW